MCCVIQSSSRSPRGRVLLTAIQWRGDNGLQYSRCSPLAWRSNLACPSSDARLRQVPPTANFKNDNHHKTSLEFIIDLFNNQSRPIEIQLESATHYVIPPTSPPCLDRMLHQRNTAQSHSPRPYCDSIFAPFRLQSRGFFVCSRSFAAKVL